MWESTPTWSTAQAEAFSVLFDPDAPQDPCNPLSSLSMFQDISVQFDIAHGLAIENPCEDMGSEHAGDLSNRTDGCAEVSFDIHENAAGSLDNSSSGYLALNLPYNLAAAADQATLLISDCSRATGADGIGSGESLSMDEPSASDEALIAMLAGCAKTADAASAPPPSPPSHPAAPPARLYWLPSHAFASQPLASMLPPLPAQSDADIALALASCSAATRSELGGDDGACWLHVPAMP